MNHQDLINTCIFEQIQGLLFSDLSGPLTFGLLYSNKLEVIPVPSGTFSIAEIGLLFFIYWFTDFFTEDLGIEGEQK